jgi:hypothetical protein
MSYININATTSASPGLQVPTPGQPLQGIPPNMSVLAAMAAGLLPANVDVTNMGTRDSRPGRTVLEAIGAGGERDTGTAYTTNGGSPQGQSAGGNSVTGAAGGFNQTNNPGGGEADIIPHNMSGTQSAVNGGLQSPAEISSPNLVIPAQPVYQG